jgi:hypothetical protein
MSEAVTALLLNMSRKTELRIEQDYGQGAATMRQESLPAFHQNRSVNLECIARLSDEDNISLVEPVRQSIKFPVEAGVSGHRASSMSGWSELVI